MGARQGAAAEAGVERQCCCETGSDIGQPLILESPDIEVPPVKWFLRPTEEDVGSSLQHALPDDDPLAVIEVIRESCERRENRLLRFLDLQQQWRVVVGHEQANGTERADAADPDNFKGDVAQMVALQQ